VLDELVFRHRSALLALTGFSIGALALVAPAPFPAEVSLALVLAAAGATLRVWGIRVLGKRARVHTAGANALQTAGPYARVRNPLYLANGAITVGVGLLAAGPWGAAAALAGVALVYGFAVRHEEVALRDLLGADYLAYAARVPRWLPLLRPRAAADAAGASPPVAWPEVLRRERRLVLGLPPALALILLVRLDVLPLVTRLEDLASWLGVPALALVLAVGAAGALANAIATERKLRRWRARRGLEAATTATTPVIPLPAPLPDR
jgi:protein-S-isoprenylcysteine O-methyltransferase Ste14